MLEKVLFVCFIALAVAEVEDSLPVFDPDYETYKFEENSNVEVYCTAYGDLSVSYSWYNPMDQLIPQDSFEQRIFYKSSINASVLIIRNIGFNDSGLYTCSARNTNGLASKIYNISVISKPTLPDNETEPENFSVKVRKVTDTSVSFKIVAPRSTTTIQARYKESLDSNYKVTQWVYSGSEYEIRNLMPSGKYSFTFLANTSESDLVYEIKKLVLLPDVPEVLYKSLKENSLKIEWFRKIDDVRRSTIDKYELSYYQVEMQRGNYWKRSRDCEITIELPSCAGSGYTIANLFSNSFYEIRLRAHTSAGYGKSYRNKISLYN